MLKVRGGHRFEGYGNVRLGTEHGTRAGWQLICYECQGLSEIIHRTGASFPPKVLTRLFNEKGWKVGNSSASDVCPACMEKRRQRAREERKQYAKGNVDRLLDMIRQVDLMLASNVTIDYGPYQPQIAAQLKSLFETAYLCNMLTEALVENSLVVQEPRQEAPPTLKAVWKQVTEDERIDFLLDLRADGKPIFEGVRSTEPVELEPDPGPEPPVEPPPAEPPVPPAPEEPRISPRTAAFLAEVRKQIFKGAAA